MRNIQMTGLKELCQNYDCFFIDQFGVLHDGQDAYEGAPEALAYLKDRGKQVLLLSNSGKRSQPNIERVTRLGFSADSFDHFLTSGEVAWNLLKNEMIGNSIPQNANCLLLTRDGDQSAISGLDLNYVGKSDEADVVIISGSRGDEITLDEYKTILMPAVQRGAICLCTNPDKMMLTSSGLRFGAGAIAELYQSLGGKIIWIGKPFEAIYQEALKLCGNPNPKRVCCIGDSIEHDIAGGASVGLSTALVRSGILADESEKKMTELYEKYKAQPNFILNHFAL